MNITKSVYENSRTQDNSRNLSYVNDPSSIHKENFSVLTFNEITRCGNMRKLKSKYKGKSNSEWLKIFAHSAFFKGYDDVLFGHVLIMVYKEQEKLSTVSISKFGTTFYKKLLLDSKSRFWPSCENLSPEHASSNVRKALAITNLKNYSNLVSNPSQMKGYWDETNAGSLASAMELIVDQDPSKIGLKLLQFGLLQEHRIESILIDFIHCDHFSSDVANISTDEHLLIQELGTQVESIFDPLLEYSPEIIDFGYRVPLSLGSNTDSLFIPQLHEVCKELIEIQQNYSSNMFEVLEKFIIPLRKYSTSSMVLDALDIHYVNKVFPPTIDEISRVNSILFESMKEAAKFGDFKILQVFSAIVPYFYRPFVRHEASIKLFSLELRKFYENYSSVVSDRHVNKKAYSVQMLDSIINGILLELPKLKLVLERARTVIFEFKVGNSEYADELLAAEGHIDSSISVIDAFGFDSSDIGETGTSTKRVFTPSGKLLEELAGNWPSCLLYGWLDRKVVGIFELENIQKEAVLEVLIIFSDIALSLSINDSEYDAKTLNNRRGPFLSDILMNSLTNGKPLPKTLDLASLNVNYWCDINELIMSTYESPCEIGGNEETFLNIISLSSTSSGFPSISNYKVLNTNSSISGRNIVSILNKAKLLHKKQPFHLLKLNNQHSETYFSVQESALYKKEACKSLFAIVLDKEIIRPITWFIENPECYLLVSLKLLGFRKIEIHACNRDSTYTFNDTTGITNFQSLIKKITVQAFRLLFDSSDFIALQRDLFYRTATLLITKEGEKKRKAKKKETVQAENKPNPEEKNEIVKSSLSKKLKIIFDLGDGSTQSTRSKINYTEQKKAMKNTRGFNLFKRLFKSKIYESDAQLKTPSVKGNAHSETSNEQKINEEKKEPLNNVVDHENSSQAALKRDSFSTFNINFEDLDYMEEMQSLGKNESHPTAPQVSFTESKFTNSTTGADGNFSDYNTAAFGKLDFRKDKKSEHRRSHSRDSTILLVSEPGEALEYENITPSPVHSTSITLNDTLSHKDSSMYDDLAYKVDDFYLDGLQNWTQITRDNSSLLNSELRALKEEAEMDTEDVIFLNESDNVLKKMDTAPDSFYTAAYSSRQMSALTLSDPKKIMETSNSKSTIQSISNFEREIESQFLHSRINSPFKLEPLTGNVSGANSEETLNDDKTTYSSERFFSTDEFEITVS